jgi:hypothetical protein
MRQDVLGPHHGGRGYRSRAAVEARSGGAEGGGRLRVAGAGRAVGRAGGELALARLHRERCKAPL